MDSIEPEAHRCDPQVRRLEIPKSLYEDTDFDIGSMIFEDTIKFGTPKVDIENKKTFQKIKTIKANYNPELGPTQ